MSDPPSEPSARQKLRESMELAWTKYKAAATVEEKRERLMEYRAALKQFAAEVMRTRLR